jgi:hypothetical protein
MDPKKVASCLMLVRGKREGPAQPSGTVKAKPKPPLFDIRDLLDLLYLEVYPLVQAHANTAFPEFRFIKISGGWRATKGELNGKSAKGNVCYFDNRSHCLVNRKTNQVKQIWDYVQESDSLDNLGTLRKLFALANCPLNGIGGSALKEPNGITVR